MQLQARKHPLHLFSYYIPTGMMAAGFLRQGIFSRILSADFDGFLPVKTCTFYVFPALNYLFSKRVFSPQRQWGSNFGEQIIFPHKVKISLRIFFSLSVKYFCAQIYSGPATATGSSGRRPPRRCSWASAPSASSASPPSGCGVGSGRRK